MRVFLFIPLLFLLISSVAAEPIEVTIENPNITVMSGDMATFRLNIKNHQTTEDSFTIVVRGPHLEWKYPGTILVTLAPGANVTVPMDFLPFSDTEITTEYQAVVSSWADPRVSVSQPFWLTVLPAIAITDMKISQSVSRLDITVFIISRVSRTEELIFDIIDGQGEVVRSSSVSVQLNGTHTISHTMSISGLSAGDYVLRAKIVSSESSVPFVIAPVRDIIESTEVVSGFLVDEVRISVTNRGNVPEYNYTIIRNITTDWITGFMVAPRSCTIQTRQQMCTFTVDVLPGQTAMVVYSVYYWPTIAEWGLLAVAVIGGLMVYFFRLTRPRIIKRAIKHGNTEWTVVLEVRAPFLKEVQDVLVRDVVSPLVHLFHTGHLKPVERRGERGIELLWQVGHLKPKEIRILSYKIKTPFEGSFRLNPATLRYASKGKRAQTFSGSVILD